MLKLAKYSKGVKSKLAATFGWLCVETTPVVAGAGKNGAAAFGRLCVETLKNRQPPPQARAAAFGRLCVETLSIEYLKPYLESSRLRAAVC